MVKSDLEVKHYIVMRDVFTTEFDIPIEDAYTNMERKVRVSEDVNWRFAVDTPLYFTALNVIHEDKGAE